ncbi:MAG TPA: hypothetical protein VN920_11665 [Pyrinomonadaceae bacterium]|nr:hypothetical protein [Pyrinomonadaceae bacterium]
MKTFCLLTVKYYQPNPPTRFAALPLDVRKVSDLPGKLNFSLGLCPDFWGRSPKDVYSNYPEGH